MFRAAVLTVSDRASRGERADRSGPAAAEVLRGIGFEVAQRRVVADEREAIREALEELCARADLVVTSGGTGLSPRDVTPEATRDILEREVPGIPEEMRRASAGNPRAMLSRAVAGARGRTLVVNLPGSPGGVRECLAAIGAALPHAIEVLHGQARDCAPRAAMQKSKGKRRK